jgi:hypothetical protein
MWKLRCKQLRKCSSRLSVVRKQPRPGTLLGKLSEPIEVRSPDERCFGSIPTALKKLQGNHPPRYKTSQLHVI